MGAASVERRSGTFTTESPNAPSHTARGRPRGISRDDRRFDPEGVPRVNSHWLKHGWQGTAQTLVGLRDGDEGIFNVGQRLSDGLASGGQFQQHWASDGITPFCLGLGYRWSLLAKPSGIGWFPCPGQRAATLTTWQDSTPTGVERLIGRAQASGGSEGEGGSIGMGMGGVPAQDCLLWSSHTVGYRPRAICASACSGQCVPAQPQ